MSKKILVTCPPMLGLKDEFIPALNARGYEVICPEFAQTVPEEHLCELLPGVDGWIIGDDSASRKVVEAGAAGIFKAAVRWGIGVDNVDFDAFAEHRIPVSNTPGMFGREVADMAMGYIVALARQTFYIDSQIKQGNWVKPIGTSIAELTVGVVGHGDIGQNLVRRLLVSDASVIVWDPLATDVSGAVVQQWPQGLGDVDFLVLACALNDQNHHMLNAEALQACKDGVRVVNVARGPLIDEQALVRAIKSGKVHSVALDVFEQEPVSHASELFGHKLNLFGSHNSSNTLQAVRKTNDRAIELLLGYLENAGG